MYSRFGDSSGVGGSVFRGWRDRRRRRRQSASRPNNQSGGDHLETLIAALSIVVIDLTLSGDNALVIGMAAHSLPPRQRKIAVLLGAGGAIGLRIVFAAMAAMLLSIPFIQFGGGLILVWIAYKLLKDENQESTGHQEASSLFGAVKVIVLADMVMSLDNILAVGGASHGSIELLVFGLALSMPLVIFGSSLLANLMNRLRWIVYVGAFVLVWTAAGMILEDPLVSSRFHGGDIAIVALTVVFGVAVFGLSRIRQRPKASGGDVKTSQIEPATPDKIPDDTLRGSGFVPNQDQPSRGSAVVGRDAGHAQ